VSKEIFGGEGRSSPTRGVVLPPPP